MKFYIVAAIVLVAVLAGVAVFSTDSASPSTHTIPAPAPSRDDAAMKSLRIP